ICGGGFAGGRRRICWRWMCVATERWRSPGEVTAASDQKLGALTGNCFCGGALVYRNLSCVNQSRFRYTNAPPQKQFLVDAPSFRSLAAVTSPGDLHLSAATHIHRQQILRRPPTNPPPQIWYTNADVIEKYSYHRQFLSQLKEQEVLIFHL
ncbi:hypothetical protein Tco_1511528, partial [Tanacetum coccineum]